VNPDIPADVFAFHSKALSAVTSAAAAAAAVLFRFFMTAATVLTVVSMTAAATLIVAAALMALAVVMMITVGSAVDKFSAEIHLNGSIRVAGRTGADLDSRVPKRVQSAAAKASAYKDFYILICKKACQCSVTDTVGTDHPTVNDLVVFYLVNFEVFCSSKVLEDISVVICNCDFHNYPF
jgi:hypothetical protein